MTNYVFKKKIGTGGSSVVFLAVVKGTLESVAVKKIKLQLSRNTFENLSCRVKNYFEFPKRILGVDASEAQREIGFLKMFSSNVFSLNLITTLDKKNSVWIVTEFCPIDCSTLFRRSGPIGSLDKKQVLQYVIYVYVAMLQLLDFMHEQRIVHRDIKPGNILMDPSGVPKLCDYGIATGLDSPDYENARVIAKGSPYYMAPEIVARTDFDGKSDIFSLGLTVIGMLRGIGAAEMFLANSQSDWNNLMGRIILKEEMLTEMTWQRTYKVSEVAHPLLKSGSPWVTLSKALGSHILRFKPENRWSAKELLQREEAAEMVAGWSAYTANAEPDVKFLSLKAALIDIITTKSM